MEPHECVFEFNAHCAADVCSCGAHKSLARCWCGWSKTDPGRGYQELAEMGENMTDILEMGENVDLLDVFPEAAFTRRFDQ